MSGHKQILEFTVNGRQTTVAISPFDMLADVLRDRLNLNGTKKGCGQGECGACTVILNGDAVNSCMIPAMRAEGASVITIEGLEESGKLHPIQQAFIDAGAVQCGFCTPGMILSTKALLDRTADPTKEEIRTALSGNICRCTGYVKIEQAVEMAAAALRSMAENMTRDMTKNMTRDMTENMTQDMTRNMMRDMTQSMEGGREHES